VVWAGQLRGFLGMVLRRKRSGTVRVVEERFTNHYGRGGIMLEEPVKEGHLASGKKSVTSLCVVKGDREMPG